MPFYEYECSNCRFYVEVLQKISEQPLRKCPSCGKSSLKKLVSAPVFRLKGSGWYETDFKSDQEDKRNLAGAEKEGAADAKSDAKSDAKPAADGDGKADTKSDAKAGAKTDAKAETKAAPSKAAGSKRVGGGKRTAAVRRGTKPAKPAKSAKRSAAAKPSAKRRRGR
jgi:putative FmdB family regulatory protein